MTINARSSSSLASATRNRSCRRCYRLKLILKKPEYIRGWLAHTEDTSLDDCPRQHPVHHQERRVCRTPQGPGAGQIHQGRRVDARADARVEGTRDRSRLARRPARPRHPGTHPRRRRQGQTRRRGPGLPPPAAEGHEASSANAWPPPPRTSPTRSGARCSNASRTRPPPSTRPKRPTGCVPPATKSGSSSRPAWV